MKLTDLGGDFLKFTNKPGVLKCHKDFKEAQGVWFTCPNLKCMEAARGGAREHAYTLLFKNAPQIKGPDGVLRDAQPAGRWTPMGKSLQDLTLLEIIRGECGWRGCIRSGEVRSTLTP